MFLWYARETSSKFCWATIYLQTHIMGDIDTRHMAGIIYPRWQDESDDSYLQK